jgi:FAD/FMN-containing dehydrogenase
MTFNSWGRYPRSSQTTEMSLVWRNPESVASYLKAVGEKGVLPVGLGRSYGDVCLNNGGTLLRMHNLDKFIAFDRQTGVLRCEAGVSLEQILALAVPAGWFLPVTPGTKFVTVGGAIANDVHGKNHHGGGTFGCYVLEFELLRSDGSLVVCSPEKNISLYQATIGGLGLTGTILTAVVQLKKIDSPFIAMDSIKFESLEEFFDISGRTSDDYEYTVSWIDCLTPGSAGRGIFMGGNHTAAIGAKPLSMKAEIPLNLPELCLNPLSMKLFNQLYYNKQRQKSIRKIVHYDPFFYPLDAVLKWNRVYGKRGFLQFQCVMSKESFPNLFREVLSSSAGSFLAVLKEFGSKPSPGLLSFPQSGVTLALDFAFRGEETIKLLRRFESIVCEAGGRIYPAKDAVMAAESFEKFFPGLGEFTCKRDPAHTSSFWRRVTTSTQ